MVDENPLVDSGVLRPPIAVIKRGQYLDRKVLHILNDSAKNPSSAYLTLGRVLEFLISK